MNKRMKIVAFYLPQYHTFPENDEWWGEGFTEWTNVKKSQPLFKGHNQPEVPYKGNYYDLLDTTVLEKQSKMALEYGVDAFCYYHYWFNGKLLMEKPLEAMLHNPNIKIEYCMCWANENWTRTWDGLENSVLIKQDYDNDSQGIKDHFNYMLQFFKDERYMKVDNKPIMVLYRPDIITNLDEMMATWNAMAKEAGFAGIYWTCQHPTSYSDMSVADKFDMGIEFEPAYTMMSLHKSTKMQDRIKLALKHPVYAMHRMNGKIKNIRTMVNYDDFYKFIIARKPMNNKMAAGAFPGWDNTPRKGRNATVYYGGSADKFKNYFGKRYERALKEYTQPFMFINAWNEWGEGAHLEPDEKYGFGYLEAIRNITKENEQ